MVVIAAAIYSLQQFNCPLPAIINNYTNDLLCIPLVLGALTFSIRYLKKDPEFSVSIGFVLFIALYYAVYFEYYLPKDNPRYTADWIDVLLYFSSGLLFYYFEKYRRTLLNRDSQKFA